MTAESDVTRIRSKLVKLREQISRESSTIAIKRQAAANSRAQAARSKSPSTVQAKSREADRHEVLAVAAEKKRADLERKVATAEKELAAAQLRREKEQAASQKKALDDLKRQAENAARRFSVPSDLAPHASASAVAIYESASYDVFLSHASEDKDDIARPLAEALIARGVSVWFDELNIRVGQSIRREIERGIRDARFGLVIISEHFIAKQWTQVELDALWGKKLEAEVDLLLPIWHKVTFDEVHEGLPLLAGLHALNTGTMSIDAIADQLVKAVRAS